MSLSLLAVTPLTASAAPEYTHGQDDQRRRDEQSAEPCHHRPERASVGLPEPEVDKETTRLGHNPRQQQAASEPLTSVRVPGPVEGQEVNEQEHQQQHPGVGMPSREELLAELPNVGQRLPFTTHSVFRL